MLPYTNIKLYTENTSIDLVNRSLWKLYTQSPHHKPMITDSNPPNNFKLRLYAAHVQNIPTCLIHTQWRQVSLILTNAKPHHDDAPHAQNIHYSQPVGNDARASFRYTVSSLNAHNNEYKFECARSGRVHAVHAARRDNRSGPTR